MASCERREDEIGVTISAPPWRDAFRQELRALALPLLLVLLLTALAWWPSIRQLADPLADQVGENFGIAATCSSPPYQLGWFGGAVTGGANLWGASLPGILLAQAGCRLSIGLELTPLQSYLLVGQLLTVVMAALACRWIGFTRCTALLAGLFIATAPCAFSRVGGGHIGLSVLLPVLPALVACLQLRRTMLSTLPSGRVLGTGAIACLLTVPCQDYYTVFSLLLLGASLALLLLLLSADLDQLRSLAIRGSLFMAGFVAMLVLLFLPKLLAAFVPVGVGVPTSWSTVRLAIDQFRYGLLPLTWFIPSHQVMTTLATLRAAGIETGSESFFWSTGSLLIPIAWLGAIRRLAQPAIIQRRSDSTGFVDADRRFLAVLLLLTSAIGLLVMTMGGLGTLFAATVTPVLRSLNRYTVFVYGASLLFLLAEFDLWRLRRQALLRSAQP